jgi:hypothetical protein
MKFPSEAADSTHYQEEQLSSSTETGLKGTVQADARVEAAGEI